MASFCLGEAMDTQIIFIFCLCDEFLKSIGFQDDRQCRMSTAEIMTFALTSALFFQCNYQRTRLFFLSHKYFSYVLSHSVINRRILRIPTSLWQQTLIVCRSFLLDPKCQEYIIDSFPVPVCQNCRILRCKLFPIKHHHGYCASKKIYFLGIKVHMIVSKNGIPIECIFTPGSESDTKALKKFEIDLPEGSYLYGDKAYNDYAFEDLLNEVGIKLIAQRKTNSKRQHDKSLVYLQKTRRKRVETVFSQITHLMPRSIHAITAKGFVVKVFLFILAFCMNMCAIS
jgi:hypothetical protein